MKAHLSHLVLVPLLLLLACVERGSLDQPSTLTFAVPGWMAETVLSPYGGFTAQFLVFSPVVRRSGDGVEPYLARSWEQLDDDTWTVHLRPDVRWHDGEPFTARDIEFTLELLSHPEVAWLSPSAYSITVLDDTTYTIVTRGRRGIGTPEDFWQTYYPRHLLEGMEPARFIEWEFWMAPVGTGPYRHLRTDPGVVIELEANPDFFRGPPRVQRVRLKLGVESVTELLAGEVDGMPYVSWLELSKLEDDPRFTPYYNVNPRELKALIWNHAHPALGDVRVRKALTMAIDRRALMQVLNFPDDVPILDAAVAPGDWQRGELPEPWPHDPGAAATLLDEAGWRDLDGDGMRTRDDASLELTIIVAGQEEQQAAVFVQDQLRRVGVRAEVQQLGTPFEVLEAGDYDAILLLTLSHGGEGTSPQSLGYLLGEGGPVQYANPRVSALLREAGVIKEAEALDAVFREIGRIIHEENPVTVLYPNVWNWVVNDRVKGLESWHRYDPLWYIEDVWVEG